MSFSRLILTLAAPAPFLVATACDSTVQLPPATLSNILDTVTIHALQGTAIGLASGFDVTIARRARTDRGDEPFDFAYDIDTAGNSVILTVGVLGLAPQSAIQMSDREFADITIAPLEDYEEDSTMTVVEDDIFIVRSRSSQIGCALFIGALPRYGKFRVLTIDAGLRQVTLEHVVNLNCGYRSLQLGVPTN
jgi:hypothetical protein